MAAGTVYVRGIRELNAAFAATDKATRAGIRAEYRTVAEPVRAAASQNAIREIRNMPLSPSWAGMRVGVTRRSVYVAPKRRATKKNPARKRPNLAALLAVRALEPALAQHHTEIEAGFELMLDRVCDEFNHTGGTV